MILRNVLRKVIAILFIVLMLVNNSMLMVVSTAVDEVKRLIDKSKIEAVVEFGVEKYVNYCMNDQQTKGVMLQANIKTGIEYQEGQEYQAIKNTGILLNMPKINEEYPEKIEVLGISTKATNGGESAKDYQQQYEEETGKLIIVALNKENEEGKIYCENVENARDEYRVIAYYSSNCYTETNEERILNVSGKVSINITDEENSEIEKELNENYKVKENISGLISTKVETSDIYNGYIESNIQNNTDYKTEYTENLGIDISYKEISDEVLINTKDFFVKNGEKQDTEEIIYKNTKINKYEVLDKLGEMPLPPYITHKLLDKTRYQTVYAKYEGSAAAPTAGLHFTKELLNEIEEMGVDIAYVTLHVGLGTFRPVKVDNILEHHMHSEYYQVSKEAADKINKAKSTGHRVIAVGTTSCRTLESATKEDGTIEECCDNTEIFIYPGYQFKMIDALITNFHLPESTLIMLVSALAGREHVLAAYEEAIKERYRFFSFGDAMIIS